MSRDADGRTARDGALAGWTADLYQLSSSLSRAVTVDAVARVAVRQGRAIVGATAGSVMLLAEGGTQFETLYSEEPTSTSVDPRPRYPTERVPCATASTEADRPVFLGSFAELQEQYPGFASIVTDGRYASSASLPLPADGSAIGVLSFHFAAPVTFDEEYTALLMSIAQHCAQALARARLYEASQRARAEAEAANRSKDHFLSTVSHELRTPLSAILGWAAMLRAGTLTAGRAQHAIDAILHNADRQAHLVNDLLDVSRIVAGHGTVDLRPLDLSESLRGAIDGVLPIIDGKGVDVRLDALPGVCVNGDARRLEQVFVNLLTNAVKFTPEGGHIRIGMAVSERSVRVRFMDTGKGIDPEFLPQVFERFRQADGTAARSTDGLGLGLFIARQLVDAHGGSIRAESEGTGKGTTVTVTLPLAAR